MVTLIIADLFQCSLGKEVDTFHRVYFFYLLTFHYGKFQTHTNVGHPLVQGHRMSIILLSCIPLNTFNELILKWIPDTILFHLQTLQSLFLKGKDLKKPQNHVTANEIHHNSSVSSNSQPICQYF